ncbi:MAG: insulinase family protein [Bacteroidetes bacterium]|nr:MAG: insulinase family protein [Bacteroidota bacterium]
MLDFKKFTLGNGLRVIYHEDRSTPLVCMNILYDVGARDEDASRTGFAHLFEHLMFGGSVNIPSYDEPLQRVGGENNAFTSNDITNYYLTVPTANLETAFWLESDRMLSLAFSEKSLEVQRNVVIEEFKQRYLNQPYGDIWLLMRPVVYKKHPYLWDTIGKEISHIAEAKMEDVKAFFRKFYSPNNAIMVLAGNVSLDEVKRLSEKWFGPIPKGTDNKRNLPVEPEQKEFRSLTVEREVPFNSIYKTYHMCSRKDKEFYAVDLLSDILSDGNSSRLYNELVKNKKMFSELNAYADDSMDKGMFVISGKVLDGFSMDAAEKAVEAELDKLKNEKVQEKELQKVQNKVEATLEFSEMNIMNKALNFAIAELMGDANQVNKEAEKYLAVNNNEVQTQAKQIFRRENCSTLYYLAKK